MSYQARPVRHRSYAPKRNNNRKPRYTYTKSTKQIDPARFVAAAKPQTEEQYVATNMFSDFVLHPVLQQNLQKKGYKTPSPIQDQTIAPGLQGRDIIGIAGTGTGKTAAFALPVLSKLMSDRQSAALIIAPTRELAQQIESECKNLAAGSGIRGALIIGGSSMSRQLRDLRYKPQIVIGTPGRIKDHLNRGTLKLEKFNLVVLDEVDRMLDMGFVHDVREILNHTSPEKQAFFFSATMDRTVTDLIYNFTQDPHTVTIQSNRASENVHQDVVRYQGSNRLDKLQDLLVQQNVSKVIIFDETQRSVEQLSKTLYERGFSVDAIHGGKSQGQRQRALRKFKESEVDILVATDVAARGIDVADISHVINYTAPKEYEDYIHRIGRAGRAGQTGYAFTFIAS